MLLTIAPPLQTCTAVGTSARAGAASASSVRACWCACRPPAPAPQSEAATPCTLITLGEPEVSGAWQRTGGPPPGPTAPVQAAARGHRLGKGARAAGSRAPARRPHACAHPGSTRWRSSIAPLGSCRAHWGSERRRRGTQQGSARPEGVGGARGRGKGPAGALSTGRQRGAGPATRQDKEGKKKHARLDAPD